MCWKGVELDDEVVFVDLESSKEFCGSIADADENGAKVIFAFILAQ